jgi:hypothetical protein
MHSQFPDMPRTAPEIHETASRVARTCRIVVQALIEPEAWAEVEKRFYLTARGELESLVDACLARPRVPDTGTPSTLPSSYSLRRSQRVS